jgi:hypothetical protein
MSDPKAITVEEFERRIAALNKHTDAFPKNASKQDALRHIVEFAMIISGGEEALTAARKPSDLIAEAVKATVVRRREE